MLDMKKFRERAGLLEGKSDPDRFRSARGARREQILGMTGLGRKPKVDLSDTRSPFDSIMDGYSQMYGSNEEIAERLRGANKEDLKEILGGLGMSEAQYKEGLDIDKLSRDAFRAVAHLGGINGAYKYIKTIDLPIGDPNKYNPEDSNGTMLSDYHQLGDSFIQGSDT